MRISSTTAQFSWQSRITHERRPHIHTRSLNASEYVRELFGPADNAGDPRAESLHRPHGSDHRQAEAIASPGFQSWLANQSAAGSDIYVGMNPIKDGAYSRTKENIKDIRHVYLDLDKR